MNLITEMFHLVELFTYLHNLSMTEQYLAELHD